MGPRRAPSLRGDGRQRCSGSAATEQDLCQTVIVTSKVNWVTTLDCALNRTPQTRSDVVISVSTESDSEVMQSSAPSEI